MELRDEGHLSPEATPASFGFSAKDEMNLAEFPIALVTDRVPEGEKTIRFQDRIFDERKGSSSRGSSLSLPQTNSVFPLPRMTRSSLG